MLKMIPIPNTWLFWLLLASLFFCIPAFDAAIQTTTKQIIQGQEKSLKMPPTAQHPQGRETIREYNPAGELIRGKDLNATNALDYVKKARQFLDDPPKTALIKVRERDRTTVIYDPVSDLIGFKTKDGTPGSVYRPNPSIHKRKDNLEYFNAE